MFENKDEVHRFAESDGIAFIDLKFVDIPGRWHHITVPSSNLDDLLERGIPFDSSSVPGFRSSACGDMNLIPDLSTGFHDPFAAYPTLSFIAQLAESDTGEGYPGDPRNVLTAAERYLRERLDASSHWLPELEFYLFDRAYYSTGRGHSGYELESEEAVSGENGYRQQESGGYHSLPPLDSRAGIRDEIVSIVQSLGIQVRYHHHENGGFGQHEIEIIPAPAVKAADAMMIIKYVVRMVAARSGLVATFMPKPLYGEPGSGMHFHQFLVRDGKSLFYNPNADYSHLSSLATAYVAGILEHAPALVGITNPTTNSYKRLVYGFEAPTKRFFGLANRCAAIRIPKYDDNPELKRVEFRPPDATCNPYLAMAAQLMAGIDGVERQLDPSELGFGPFDEDVEKWPSGKKHRIKDIPRKLESALSALEEGDGFLRESNVFVPDLLDWHIENSRALALDVLRRPTAREMELYFDL